MSKKAHIEDKFSRGLKGRLATMGFLCVLMCGSAYADDDPFDIESGHWMSFDHYKDAAQRGTLDAMQLKPPAPPEIPIDAPAAQSAPAPAPASAAPAIAALSRPVDLPIMPGVNKGYSVQVNSTEDDRPSLPVPVINPTSTTTAPDIHLSDKNWQSPSSLALAHKNDDDDGDTPPINVRMTFLPDKKIVPIATNTDRETAQHKAHLALEKSTYAKKPIEEAAAPVKTPGQLAACAAIDAYKKQQLEAIQSDRQTLQALQTAINSLGLQKQLDFMTGANGAINASEAQTSSQTNTSVATTVR